MNADVFFDTNIFIYSFDEVALRKQQIADDLIRRSLQNGSGTISYQVVQEFLNIATRKFSKPLSHEDAISYMRATLEPLWKVSPSAGLYESALAVRVRYQYGFYDSLIIAAALDAGCATLYSEDMQHDQQIEGLTIRNPFLKGARVKA